LEEIVSLAQPSNSIVGTTVSNPENLPEHLCCDEKHSWLCGKRVYIPTTIGGECVLGVSVAPNEGTDQLYSSYSQFKEEAQILKPDDSPKTVNMDSWEPTKNAWKILFPMVNIILCFLHIYISIRD
jgi:hypothetical protein